MLELNCPNCGGSLKCDPLNFVEFNGVFIYTNIIDYTCEYCNSKFQRNQPFTPHNITNINTNGGAYIGGNVTILGSFAGRNLIITGNNNAVVSND